MSETATEIPRLETLAEAPLPTAFGTFRMVVFRYRDPAAHPDLSDEHIALVAGDVDGQEAVPVRVHSECMTSEVFGSLKCDCKQQLEAAQSLIERHGRGVLLYLRQEGRGIGLANKVRAYALQAQGADTIEANEKLHLPVDARQYGVAAEILRSLGVRSVQLITNNPAKQEALTRLGISVVGRIPVQIAANPHSESYLSVKRDRMRHLLPQVLVAKH
ncbi:MAG TPA: GTP cyclohydrolase II [Polyangiaceae bacterium]|nr:GTP cyclohydrolase II [Polyangiaceae bacterium]